MKLMLLTLALTLGVGYLLGGRLSNLADLRIRWAPLAVVGFAMQLINPPGPLAARDAPGLVRPPVGLRDREPPHPRVRR